MWSKAILFYLMCFSIFCLIHQRLLKETPTLITGSLTLIILIKYCRDIQQLGYFLTVPQGLDNFMALRVWVERELVRLDGFSSQSDLSQLHDILYDEVRSTFVRKFPENMLQYA